MPAPLCVFHVAGGKHRFGGGFARRPFLIPSAATFHAQSLSSCDGAEPTNRLGIPLGRMARKAFGGQARKTLGIPLGANASNATLGSRSGHRCYANAKMKAREAITRMPRKGVKERKRKRARDPARDPARMPRIQHTIAHVKLC